MAQTKLNLSDSKFEQLSSEVLHLSGCTHMVGQLQMESGSTLSILQNAGAGKVLVSDALGVVGWQTNISATGATNGLHVSGKDIALGGTLTGDTIINLENKNLCINNIVPAFNTGSGFDTEVSVLALQLDGKVIAGGQFTTYSGVTANHIIRLNSNGSIDNSFSSGNGLNGSANAILIQPDGKIIVGGIFQLYSGETAMRIIRLNSNGSIDGSFSSGSGFDDDVYSLFYQLDGKILVGGNFYYYSGSTVRNFTRLNSDGSIDNTFFNNGTKFNNNPNSIVLQSDGKIIVGGIFTLYSGVTANHIIRLNSNGSVDDTFVSGIGFDIQTYTKVNSLALQSDDKILAGGGFSTYSGVTANRIIRLNSDGSIDNSFVSGTGFNNDVYAIALQSDGKILVGGIFTLYSGATANNIIRLNSNGSIDPTFVTSSGFNGIVESLAIQSDGKILVGGIFTLYSGATANNIIRLNSNGSIDNVAEIYDVVFNGKVVEYSGDYSVNYRCLSIPNAGWVTGQTSSAFGWSNLANGSTVAGCSTIASTTTTCQNTFYGVGVGKNITTGCDNIGIGYNALSGVTSDCNNIAIGNQAMMNNCNGGEYNIAIGNQAMMNNCNGGVSNVGIGYQALLNNNGGSNNIGIGYLALYYNTIGGNNIANGSQALFNNICGYDNIAIGNQALSINTSGNTNIAIGGQALTNNTSGEGNVGIGYNALGTNTSGNTNIAIGYNALGTNTIGYDNIAIGCQAGFSETGSNKLYIANSDTKSLIYGEFDNEKLCVRGKLYVSGLTNASKSNVIYYDSSTKELTYGATPSGGTGGGITGATNGLTAASCKVSLGGALTKNTAITGAFTLSFTGGTKLNTTCGYQISGYTVMCVPTNAFTGNFSAGYSASASMTGGTDNTAFGAYANNGVINGGGNTAIGSCALRCGTKGNSNTAVGSKAGCKANNGNFNTLIGAVAATQTCGSENTIIGYSTFISNLTGSGNTAIGMCTLAGALGNGNVAIGRCAGFSETGSNKLYIANCAAKSLIYGEFDNEKLCVRGKLYVSGLTNSTKSNVIYYDSSTKELTYGATSSGGTGSVITGATNGLGVTGKNICLGGALVKNTAITGAYTLSFCSGALLNTQCGYQISGVTMFRTSTATNTSVFIGSCAGTNGAGINNIGIGNGVLTGLTTGCGNIGMGCNTLDALTFGNQNVGIGTQTLSSLTNGSNNIAIGCTAMYNGSGATAGNVAIGASSLKNIVGGNNNTAIGTSALEKLKTGNCNVGVGYWAACKITTGCQNIGIGYDTLNVLTTGSNNIAIGRQAGSSLITGCTNIFIGYNAGFSETGSNKLYIANSDTKSLIYGEFDNEKLCVRGKLYVSGLTNASKSNVIYYDSSTKELTYGATPSGGTSSAFGWSNLTNGSTVAGCGTLASGGTVNHNTYYGVCAGTNTTVNGGGNVGVGYLALNKNTNGCFNYAFGYCALSCNTIGNFNVAIGDCVLYSNTTGSTNIAIGSSTLSSNTIGTGNVGVGSNILTSNISGNQNFAFGSAILNTNSSGSNNIGIGNTVLASNTTGCFNIGIGIQTLHMNTTGCNNVTLGQLALFNNSTGSNNLAIGRCALLCNTTGSNNIAVGSCALRSNTGGTDNIAMGLCSLCANTTGVYNFAAGYKTLVKSTVGFSNIAIGYQALCANLGGTDNTGFGWLALQKNTSGCNNFGAGNNALTNNTTGCFNIGIGNNAGAGSTTGSNNISIGCYSYCNNATGTDNIAIGNGALFGITGGSNNVAIGRCAANSITGNVSNMLLIGNCTSTFLIKGDFLEQTICNGGNTTAWQQTSDARIKENVCTISNAIGVLKCLNPVIYDYTTGYSTGRNWNECKRVCNYGFVAQEYEQVFPKYTTQHSEIINGKIICDFRSIDTGHLVPILVKAIIEQQSQINDLYKKLNDLI